MSSFANEDKNAAKLLGTPGPFTSGTCNFGAWGHTSGIPPTANREIEGLNGGYDS